MPNSNAPAARYLLLPWALLLLGLALTYWLQNLVRESARAALDAEFDFRASELADDIHTRLKNYEQVLKGAAGLFAASEVVQRQEFNQYFQALQLEERFPGVQGLGYARLVSAQDKASHIEALRAEGLANYDIRPSGARALYTSIIYLEPADWRNQRAIGYDMYSEPIRRAAMEIARDQGETSISGKVRLVQETEEDVQPGFLMYLPIYRPRAALRSVEDRRLNLVGWVYAPFRMRNLMAGILGHHFGEVGSPLHLKIYDGNAVDAAQLMFDSDRSASPPYPGQRHAVQQLLLFDRPWTIVVDSQQDFDARLKRGKAGIIAIYGSLSSLLLALVAWLLVTGRARALGMAEAMTSDLRQSAATQRRLNRALRLLSDCNTSLVHVSEESRLLAEICRLCVDSGGYVMAWVGYAVDDAAQSVKPVGRSGYESGYLDGITISWGDNEHGQGPTGTAIRSAQTTVNQNVLSNPKMAPWRAAAIQRGYQSSVALPLVCDAKVLGALTIYASAPDAFDPEEVRLLEELAADLSFGIQTLRTRAERDRIAEAQRHHEETLRKGLEQSIEAIAGTLEARDPYTAGHQHRVALLSTAIACEIGLAEDRIQGLKLAASIHDLGKIKVPSEILSKPGRLSDIEMMLIKSHAQTGYEILRGITFPWPIADIVHQHHEKLDGSGYPQGLKGEQILLESRILTVADVVEAMSSNRPYRPALGIEVALKEIERGRGSAYDPVVADACLKLFRGGGFAFPD